MRIDRIQYPVIPVNSVKMPARFVQIASRWYGSMGCVLYAICSTGALTTGTNCPITDYEDELDRNQRWYYALYTDLAATLRPLVGYAEKEGDDDYDGLVDFLEYADGIVELLGESYGLDCL